MMTFITRALVFAVWLAAMAAIMLILMALAPAYPS